MRGETRAQAPRHRIADSPACWVLLAGVKTAAASATMRAAGKETMESRRAGLASAIGSSGRAGIWRSG